MTVIFSPGVSGPPRKWPDGWPARGGREEGEGRRGGSLPAEDSHRGASPPAGGDRGGRTESEREREGGKGGGDL